MSPRRQTIGRVIAGLGGVIFATPLVSGFPLEAKVTRDAKYEQATAERHNRVAIKGRDYFVSDQDWWRIELTPYIFAAGGVAIWIGWKLQGRNV